VCNHLATFVKDVAEAAEVEARRSWFGRQLRNVEAVQLVPLRRRSAARKPTTNVTSSTNYLQCAAPFRQPGCRHIRTGDREVEGLTLTLCAVKYGQGRPKAPPGDAKCVTEILGGRGGTNNKEVRRWGTFPR